MCVLPIPDRNPGTTRGQLNLIEAIDHVNLVVTDLQVMTQFYEEVLGFAVSKRVAISGPWVEKVTGTSGVEAKVVYLDPPQGPRIELIQYLSPSAARPTALGKPYVPGVRHIAFRVSDIDQVAGDLEASGARLVSPVQQVPDNQVTYSGGARKRLVYFLDPEDNLLELCEYR